MLKLLQFTFQYYNLYSCHNNLKIIHNNKSFEDLSSLRNHFQMIELILFSIYHSFKNIINRSKESKRSEESKYNTIDESCLAKQNSPKFSLNLFVIKIEIKV